MKYYLSTHISVSYTHLDVYKRQVLCLVQKSVAIGILFIILTHNLQGKKTYQVNQHNNDHRCTDYIFPLPQIIISFHYFFLLIASAHNIQMMVIEASVNIFNNKTGRLKNEKVSMTSKMVQNKKVHNKIYRKKGENPILLIPGSKSSTLSRSVTNRNTGSRIKASTCLLYTSHILIWTIGWKRWEQKTNRRKSL